MRRKEDSVAHLDERLDEFAVLRGETRANGDDGGKVVLRGVLLRDVDSGRGFLWNLDSLDQDSVEGWEDRLGGLDEGGHDVCACVCCCWCCYCPVID